MKGGKIVAARKNLSILVRNDDTGEIFETDERMSAQGSFTICEPSTEEQKKHQENLRNQKSLSKELGGFVKVLYYNNEVLFDEQLGLSKSTITRLMMLSTYLDFNNVLVKELPKRRQTADKTHEPMERRDIQNVLILEKTAFTVFMKEVEACGILIKCDDCYKLSSDVFYKGEMSRDVCFTKMYVETVRELYRSVVLTGGVRAHSTLSFVFQLITIAIPNEANVCPKANFTYLLFFILSTPLILSYYVKRSRLVTPICHFSL